MAVCANCVIGSLDEGTPKGKESTIAGVPCYISDPSTGSSAAIILGTDVFGYKLPNARLIADAFADNGFLCVVPDYFKREPMDMQMLLTYESLPGLSLLGKARSYLWLAWKWMGMGAWLKRHPADCAIDVVTAAAAELRDKHGARKVGLQGRPGWSAHVQQASNTGRGLLSTPRRHDTGAGGCISASSVHLPRQGRLVP